MSFGAESTARISAVVDACELHGHDSIVVLSGVAGTGKTYLGLAAAQKFCGHPLLVKQVQFHQSFSYEDFFEGLQPTPQGGFQSREGVFLEWNEAALRDPNNRYVLLIEELTRANVSAVLGELMTYIEYRDRLFETPLTRRRVRIADNLVVLATMNPQDRSALSLDDALIRRLRIVECPPSVAQLKEMLSAVDDDLVQQIARIFEECSQRYPQTFESTMPFGHGVFAGVQSTEDLKKLWHQRIKHVLRRGAMVPPHPFTDDIEELYPWR